MMVFNSFNLLYYISRFYEKSFGVPYTEFYSLLEKFCKNSDGIFSAEYKKVKIHAQKGYSGAGWDHYDSALGDISWPIEEAAWLRLAKSKRHLSEEAHNFIRFLDSELSKNYDLPSRKITNDLIKFQLFTLNFPVERFREKVINTFKYDWIQYFEGDEHLFSNNTTKVVKYPKVKNKDIIQWGYESIWFGRRSMRYKSRIKEMEVIPSVA